MKKNTPLVWMLAGLLLASPVASHAHGDKQHGEISAASLDSLYSSYLEIRKSFARDDLAGAKKAGNDFLLKPVDLPRELSHTVAAMDLLKDLRAVGSAEDLESGRKAFSGLSDRMVALMAEAGYAGRDSAMVFFCPMANGRKGARWLQDSRETSNPYFGKSMPTCGSMKNQLSPSAGKKSGKG
jgi:hypothetical protein